MFRKSIITLITIVFLFSIGLSNVYAQGIFGGGSSSGDGGIFGNIRESIQSIFDSIGVGVPGGAVIPGITPIPESEQEIPVGPNLPPSPDETRQIKLSMQWDALSLGGEVVEPLYEDPLLGEDNLFGMTTPDTNPWGLPDLRSDFLKCPDCGGSSYNSVVIDEYNRVLPAIDGKVLSGSPPGEPPRNRPPNPGGSTVSPWEICPQQTYCLIADVERVLTGWCGQDPDLINAPDRIPQMTLDSQPGPNMFALPNAVSNKYVRRDGYAFKCVSDCASGSCVTENYVEFQTEIYPSNAISLYAQVENPTARVIEDVLVRATTLTYSPDGENPLPHNVDFPLELALAPATDSVIQTGDFGYVHGSTLGAKSDQGLSLIREIPRTNPNTTIVDPQYDLTSNIDMSILRNIDSNTQQPELIFGPFDIGPGEVIDLPFQPISSEITRIPDSLGSYDTLEGGVDLVQPATPCECKAVRLHRGRNDDLDCNTIITNPTDDQCRLYYGIATPIPDHAGGYICDQGGITVGANTDNPCPPPWCFERPPGEEGYAGPIEQCPGGQLIPLPANWNDEYDPWYYNVDFGNVNFQTNETQNDVSKEDIAATLRTFLPDAVVDFYYPPVVQGYGCTQPCQNDPPPGLSGIGGIIPRDYNFICDPDDLAPNQTTMYEQQRCEGTDPQVFILPDDPRFQVYRDVTGVGGCGYYASSDNSVIGPIQFVAEYGGNSQDPTRTSRSVILGSIPVGGRILDDQGRPFGWPITGEIEEQWGPTSLADSNPGRANPEWDYGEYRYCAAGQN